MKKRKRTVQNKANSFNAIRHAIKEFEKIYGKKVSHIVLLQPTSPFREARHINKALEKFFESKANSLSSVVKAKDGNKFLVYLKKGKPIILSTGMETMQEIQNALEVIYKTGNKKIIALHCTTNYPCDLKQVNLNAMLSMKEELDCLVGFSDHSLSMVVPGAASAFENSLQKAI